VTRHTLSLQKVSHFIACQHAMHAERDIVLANPSVCPSVCLSVRQTGIVSKRLHISSNSFHRLEVALL